MKKSAWSAISKMVGRVYGWHFFTVSIMDGYHSASLFVENRPTGIFLYFADQNFTSLLSLLEEGSTAGFRQYRGRNFDKYIEAFTHSNWPDHFEKCKTDNPGKSDDFYLRKCDHGTLLTIWKLKREGASSGTGSTTPPKEYTVVAGDTLSGIASRYEGVTVESIQRLNRMRGDTIQIGQKLKLRE